MMRSITLTLLLTALLMASGTSSLQPRSGTPPPPPPLPNGNNHYKSALFSRAGGAQPQTLPLRQRLSVLARKSRGGAVRLKAIAINGEDNPTIPKDTSMVNNPYIPTAPSPLSLDSTAVAKAKNPVAAWIRQMLPEFAAEAFGTFLLLQLALGIVLTANFIPGAIDGIFPLAAMTGMAITAACAAVSSQCAAHFNPAITLAMCLYRNFGWSKFVPYLLAQFVGSTLAALVNFGLYAPHIAKFEAANGITRASLDGLQTAKTMACYSAGGIPTFLAEAFGTFALTSVVFSLTSDKNHQVQGLFIPPIVGSAVALIISVIGPLTGASMNPAREVGPRLVLQLFGWSSTIAWKQLGLYVSAAAVGATCGGFMVDKFIYAAQQEVEENGDDKKHLE